MASGIPKRATNVKRKERRAASWKRGQEKKQERKADQTAREEHNRKVGTTGKQRANAARKAEAARPDTVVVESEDLLEL